MEELRPRSGRKLHWHDEGAKRRREIAEKISELPLTHLVVIRTHLSGEAPERQRRHCMERLLYELGQTAVSTVTFESRGPKDDQRDRDMLDALRARRIIHPSLRMEHAPGPRETMLWVADALCGAAAQFQAGEPIYLRTMQTRASAEVIFIGQRPGKS